MVKFYDTNALLTLQEKLFDDGEKFYISDISLREIEDIKTSKHKDEEIKRDARHLAKLLDEHKEHFSVSWLSKAGIQLATDRGLAHPDGLIASTAVETQKIIGQELLFVTDDICCKILAEQHFGLKVTGVDEKEVIYQGYQHIVGNTEYINDYLASSQTKWLPNEYAIIHNTDDNSEKEMRYDGEKFVALRLPPSKVVKAKNSLQRCALDLLTNPAVPIVALLGGPGSGKTYLSMKMAKYLAIEKGNYSRILGVREPRGEGKEVGFLPGELANKTEHFFAPLVDQLDGGEFELEGLKMRGALEEIIPYYMKGRTYNDTIILVDEAEDLTEKQIKLIGTRLGENSKVFFSGDYKQSLINVTERNALVRMCNELKENPMAGCIYLGEDVRSNTSKVFASLFAR